MSRRQDYIARIRYQNELPPPPCPPKLLDTPIDTIKLASSSTFLSNLIRKQPVNVDVDIDLGMPLDLIEVQGIFDRGDESGIYPLLSNPSVDQLDPKDRALLRNPQGVSSVSKSQPGVSFLRRTEYISSEAIKQSSVDSPSKATALLRQKRLSVANGPEEQLKLVENTFDVSSEDLSKLQHPKKKHLKAVESWQLFPDSKMFDLSYVSVKLVGSASLSSSKRKFAPESLATSIFRQNVANNNEEWMSFYTADEETAKKLKTRLDSTDDTLVDDDDENKTYRFTRVQDNDIELKLHPSNFTEIAISFTDDGEAYYLPVIGRTSLKRRRVTTHKQELVDELSIGAVDLSLREITAKESTVRDNLRSEYDKVSYPYSENVDDDEDDDNEIEE